MALLAAALAGYAATVAASAGPTAAVAQGELEGYLDGVRTPANPLNAPTPCWTPILLLSSVRLYAARAPCSPRVAPY